MRQLRHRLGHVGIALLTFALGGCAPSRWETSFTPSPRSVAVPLAKDAHVRLREVPWERVQGTLDELNKEITASDTHPDEWPVEKREAAKAKLLKGLQISSDPGPIEVLGSSEFAAHDTERPTEEDLLAFARRIGATTVVWSCTYLGKSQTIVDRPVTEFRDGPRWRDRDGRWHESAFSGPSTTWVPVVVNADERGWMAFFLREPAGK